MDTPYEPVKNYYDARFRVQSILLLDSSDSTRGYGKIYVTPLSGSRTFKPPNFRPSLVNIICEGDDVQLNDNQDNPILRAIASRIKTPMYSQDRVTREGQIRRHGGEEQSVEWGQAFLEEVRERGGYLSLYLVLKINPSEWDQTPIRQTGEPTVAITTGSNVKGHLLPGLEEIDKCRPGSKFTRKFS